MPQALGEALVRTLQVAVVAMVAATVLGVLLAVGRLSDHRWVRIPVTTLIEFFRAIPLLVVIFALYFVLPAFGADLSAFAALALGPDPLQHGRARRDLPGRHPVGGQGPAGGRASPWACARPR